MINKFFSKFVAAESDIVPSNYVNRGSTGTEVYSGHYSEEYLNNFLSMPEGMLTYDKMRRSDAQIKMLRSSVRNPILAANWHIEAVDDTPEEREIKDFLEFVLMQDISYPDGSKRKTWLEFLTEALSFMDFGFAAFEIIHKVVTGHPIWGNYVGLRDLAFRSQKTIYEWNLLPNGGIKDVRQLVNGDLAVDVRIPGENLLVFTCDKEGDNYEGISLLRAIYGNWFRKNVYHRLQAIGVERSAVGTPIGTLPADKVGDTEQVNKFIDIMRLFTQNQKNYIIKPAGFELEIFDLEYDPAKLDAVIENEDKRMAKAFLANFMELGMSTGGGGSYALGSDLSDIFLGGIQLYAQQIADGINAKVLETLVKAKYGVRQKYPRLKVTGIYDKAGKEMAEIAVMLKNAGLIRDSDQLEDALNRDYGFPVITADQKEADLAAGIGRKSQQVQQQPLPAPDKGAAQLSERQFADKKSPIIYIGQRAKMAASMMQANMLARTNKYLASADKALRATTTPAARRRALNDLTIPDKLAYKNALRLFLAETTSVAVSDVLKELGKSGMKFDDADKLLKNVPAASRAKLKVEVDTILQTQDDEMIKRMFFIASQRLDTTDSVDSLIMDMRKARDSYLSGGVLATAATNAVSGAVNTARNAVFQTPEVFQEIESFILINPAPESAICQNLVGRVFSKDEYLTADLPPYHHNCKTTVAAQLTGQKDIKPINPIGLTPTGDAEQVAAILKSKTFSEHTVCGCN